MLECVSRDGCFCVNIAMRPDGSLDDGSLRMLADVGDWMKINGEAIYGSRAWIKLGEGENGHIRSSPAGKIDRDQAAFRFGTQDFRFTEGKDGSVYAFCMAVPQRGSMLKITSMGTASQPSLPAVKSVSLLGSPGLLEWTQERDGLAITCPDEPTFRIALVFKIRFAGA